MFFLNIIYDYSELNLFNFQANHTCIKGFIHEQIVACKMFMDISYINTCTTVACLPPIRGLEKCRVIGHNPHFSSLCSLSCLNPKMFLKGI